MRVASFIYPGLGQLLDGRWLSGLSYAGLATAGLLLAVVPYFTWLFRLYAILLDGGELTADQQQAPWGSLIGGIVLVLVVYVVSILDPGGRKTQSKE